MISMIASLIRDCTHIELSKDAPSSASHFVRWSHKPLTKYTINAELGSPPMRNMHLKAATIMLLLIICISYAPVEVNAANIIEIYDSYAVSSSVEVGRMAKTVWIARWQHNQVIITEGLDATITGDIPLEYSLEYGGWVGYDVKFEAQTINYSIESASTDISWSFIQTAQDITINFYGEIVVVTNTTTPTTSTTTEEIFIPPMYPEVFNSGAVVFAMFLGAIVTILWKVNKDLGDD